MSYNDILQCFGLGVAVLSKSKALHTNQVQEVLEDSAADCSESRVYPENPIHLS